MSNKATPIWCPSKERRDASRLTDFLQFLKLNRNLVFENYSSLYKWSIDDSPAFWESAARFFDLSFHQPFSCVLRGEHIRTASWFTGATLNFAEHLLKRRDTATAITYWSEDNDPTYISYADLHCQVESLAHSMRSMGVVAGDRVAAFISNRPEAVIGMLAASSIGAIWSSCSPDFGFQGVLDRFGQIEPKILIAVEGYSYNGTYFPTTQTLAHILDSIPAIQQLVLIPTESKFDHPKSISWDDFLCTEPEPLTFESLPFDHPLYLMYSSGTTGKPKCMLHGAGGTLLQHLKELVLHTDLKPEDSIAYFTTCGWMMWNWMVTSLAVGANIVLYDGSPAYPDLGILFKMIETEKIGIFGTSPKFLSSCESTGLVPKDDFDLGSLKTLLSTGAPLSDANFDYVYKKIKEDIQLASISGGTDIISCFMLGNPLLPVYKGELQCRGLGMKVETLNDQGNPVFDSIGELVCTAPFPSRPVSFWNDPKDELYENAYFKHFNGIWRHGDFVKINRHGGCIVFGRSDATLNPGGVRIGTAEIYGPVEALPEIIDSIVVGKKNGMETSIILFVVPADGITLNDALKERIRQCLRHNRSPRHVPAEIHSVPTIPRTISGKKVELAVTKAIHGQPITNLDALANPEALAYFHRS